MNNAEMIEKAITTSTFADGGSLNTDQQTRFVSLIRRFGVLLSQVRFVRLSQANMDIDKLHIGEPVTRSATENTGSTTKFSPKFNKVTINAKKVRTDWDTTTETLQQNIERNQFETTLMTGIAERMATDLELLAIQGDDSLTGDDPLNALLATHDGWDIQSANGHIVDVLGGNIQKAVWSDMRRALPKQFKQDRGLRFMCGDDTNVDWIDTLADRGMGVGDAALQGVGIAPYGIPLVVVNLIPEEKTVSGLTEAGSAFKIGTEYGPFSFDASSSFEIAVDNGPLSPSKRVTVTITGAGVTKTLDTVEVAKLINDALVADTTNHGTAFANVARDDGTGRLMLISPTTGTTSTIEVSESGSPNDTLNILGIGTSGFDTTYTGTAANAGTAPDGTFCWLTNPQNLIFAMLDGTRIFTEFNKDTDVIESVIYNQVDAKIENYDALVKAVNVRKKTNFA